jgi:hypothetical protein
MYATASLLDCNEELPKHGLILCYALSIEAVCDSGPAGRSGVIKSQEKRYSTRLSMSPSIYLCSSSSSIYNM